MRSGPDQRWWSVGFGLEDVRGIGPEGTIPERIYVAVDEVELVGV